MFFIVYVLVLCFASFSSAFIQPKLLLPYYENIQVNYTIQSEEGCYKWSSQNSDVASIEPIPKDSVGCTASAIVFVQSKSPTRRITLILAENEITGTILQCDVIVDRIASIDITSRTRELYLDDPPETLKLRALDDEGNTFSSTAYLLFNWKILPDEDAVNTNAISPQRILHVGQFIETDYAADPYVEELERRGLQSDTVLLSGLQTGTAYVMAQLTFSRKLMTSKIPIVVRDKVFLIPNGAVWISLYGKITYRVEKWRNGRPSRVVMPHEQYFLQLGNSLPDENSEEVVVTLDTTTSIVIGYNLGQVQLYLMDRNLKKDTIQDSCHIRVVEPAHIRFSIIPDGRWVLETSRRYIIIVYVHDHDHHQLYPSSNFRITSFIDPLYFEMIESVDNGTWYSVIALQKGVTKLYAKLDGILTENGDMHVYDPVIETTQVAEIFDPIVVRPPIVAFPWHPKPVFYRYRVKAAGGSGNYTWSIDNNTFAIVSSNGMVTTKVGPEQEKVHAPGSAVVRATDIRNPAHWGSADVILAPVVEILFARSHREAEIDSVLNLYLSMFVVVKEEMFPVADCRRSGVVWSIQDPSVFRILEDTEVDIPEIDGTMGCLGLRLRALKEGYTVIHATFRQTQFHGLSAKLDASVTIAAFPPLRAIDPVNIAVVSLDSSKLLRFRGGPNRWPLWHSGHEKRAASNNTEITTTSLAQSSHHDHQVIARCLTMGYSKITMRVFNNPCNTNPIPIVVSASVRVLCDVPHHLDLSVSPLLPKCPLHHVDIIQTVALIDNQFSVNVTTYNNFDLLFDNFTSIVAEWSSSVVDTTFISQTSIFRPVDTTEQRKHILNQMIKLPKIEGEQTITVSLTKYRSDTSSTVCNMFNCQQLEPVVSESVGVLAVAPPRVCPDQALLFNHDRFDVELRVEGGSEHFETSIVPHGRVASIVESSHNYIKIVPVSAGSVRLQVVDLCLGSHAEAYADVTVVEVGKIILRAPPRLALDSSCTITIEVEDNLGQPLPSSFFSYLDLVVESSAKDILSIGPIGELSDDDSLVALANITGANVGATMLTAATRMRDGRIVRSNAVHLVVISLLELYPPEITLVVHQEFQLRTMGGPRSDYTMKFIVENEGSEPEVNVSQSGVVHALQLGVTRVSAVAVMHDGAVFYCRRPTVVRVVQLSGIRVDSPLTQFHVGGTVPLHVNGLSDLESPMSFGSAVPGLIFQWESANPSVVKLHTVHAKDDVTALCQAGIDTGPELSFTMLAEGMSPGHCVITVAVTAQNGSVGQLKQRKIVAEISLMVYDPLVIVSAESFTRKRWRSTSSFLITPSTNHHLETNRDGLAKSVHYQVLPDQKCTNVEVVEDDDDDDDSVGCLTVDDKGSITSGPNQCQSTILVTSIERFGVNQTLALHVLVRPVSYVIARSITEFRTRESTPISYAFPLGAAVKFVVNQFDEAADMFDATGHDVILTLNRYDRVEVQPESGNRSFTVRLPLEGTTVMSVESYLKSTTTPSAVYYFPINVLPALKPQKKQLTVGLKFCFLTEFININGTDGSWHSRSPKFVAAPKTGAVLAVARGDGEVSYSVDNLQTTAQVTGAPFVASLHDGRLTGPLLSKHSVYSLPIHLFPNYPNADGSKCAGLDAEMDQLAEKMFSCSVRFVNSSNLDGIYSAHPQYSAKSGYVCRISRRDLNEDDRIELASVNDSLRIALNVLSSSWGSIQVGVTTLPFYPSFHAHISSNTLVPGSYVLLCIAAPVGIFTSIKIIPSDTSVLYIKEHEVNPTEAFCYRVATDNRDLSIRSAYFRVISHLTEQEERFDLIIDRVAGRLVSSSLPCSSVDRTSWKGAGDILSDTYLAYLSSLSVIIISVAILLAAITAYKWVTSNNARSSRSFTSPPPPYNLNSSGPNTPRGPGSPGSTPKTRLWSRYYQPQQASPSTG